MREAPALILIDKILRAGGKIKVYDPIAMDECRRRVGDKVEYARSIYEAAIDADALLIVTEWKEFRVPDWIQIKKTMSNPLILDGRNIYDIDELQENGFEYHCIGR